MQQQQNELILRVADNGIGKQNTQNEEKGFGSEPIDMLSMQLRGELQESSEAGFQMLFRFPHQRVA